MAYLRSLLTPETLGEIVEELYGFRIDRCVLLRSLTNDVYELRSPEGTFALKLYGAGGWSVDEVVWEQELALHLTSRGVPVARPVPLTDGRLAGEVDAVEGMRPLALTEFVVGRKPAPPFDDELYREFGVLAARFHEAAATFSSSRPRGAFDVESVLEEHLDPVVEQLAEQPHDQALIRDLAGRASVAVTDLASDGLRWGTCHGDVTLDNVHRSDGGLVLHDLDQAGPGWLAADLTGVWSTDHWAAFADGYRQVQPLTSADLAALKWLDVVVRIANLRFHLVDKPTRYGRESVGEGWADRELTHLRAVGRRLASAT